MVFHSTVVTVIATLAAIVAKAGFEPRPGALALFAFVGVLFVGLPHGGLDYSLGTKLVTKVLSGNKMVTFVSAAIFLLVYLCVGGLVIAGWYVIPLVTIAVFFALASWHFGLEEEPRAGKVNLADHLCICVRGGMIVWCLAFFRPDEMTGLLQTIVPATSSTVRTLVSSISGLGPFLFLLLVLDTFRRCFRSGLGQAAVVSIRLSCLICMFAACPILLSFTIYFCGWHSIRGLSNLRSDFSGYTTEFLKALAPATAGAIILFLAGVLIYRTELSLNESMVRTMFIGLSAVAIPHLLLHIIADSLRETRMAQQTTREVISELGVSL